MCAESVLDVVGDGWVQDVASHVVGGGFATDRQAGVRSGSRTRSGGGLRSLVLPRAVVQGSFLGALGVAGVFLGPWRIWGRTLGGGEPSRVLGRAESGAHWIWPGCARVSYWSIGGRHRGNPTVHSARVQIPSACTVLASVQTVSSMRHESVEQSTEIWVKCACFCFLAVYLAEHDDFAGIVELILFLRSIIDANCIQGQHTAFGSLLKHITPLPENHQNLKPRPYQTNNCLPACLPTHPPSNHRILPPYPAYLSNP